MKAIKIVSLAGFLVLCLLGLPHPAAAQYGFVNFGTLANHDGATTPTYLWKNYNNLTRNQRVYSLHDNVPFVIYPNAENMIFIVLRKALGEAEIFPVSVSIDFQKYARVIYFFGHISLAQPLPNEIVGKYVINYADASQVEISLDENQASPNWNIDDHCCGWRARDLATAYLAWQDLSQEEKEPLIREFIWTNPHPEKKIATIDFISFDKGVNPVLCGITYLGYSAITATNLLLLD
jgi:hypothetical protein